MDIKASYKPKKLAKPALFAATLIWGSSFTIIKDVINTVPPFMLLSIRFLLSCALLCAVFCKSLKKINKEYLYQGAICGVLIFAAYSFQTIGVSATTPGKNAFLTSVYCVIVPFLFWAVNKIKPDIYNFLAAALCIIGIAFVSLTTDFKIGFGDAFTLIGGFFYAAHMVAVSRFGKKDPVLLTIVQFAVSGALGLITTLIFEPKSPIALNSELVLSIAYLTFLCTAVALLMQNFGQKYVHPAGAAIILSFEAVFGVLFSVLLYGETLTPRVIAGFTLIFVAVIVSETKLNFFIKKST